MGYSSKPGENVLDLVRPACGSTLIAAEQTGRRAFLMDSTRLYCDVIVPALGGGTRARRRSGLGATAC